MKKAYIQPTMKVRKIQCSHMLCGSTFGINRGESVSEASEYDDNEGYGIAW